eukprot:GHVQ01015642.1.p2 GENE.GHVQ01015642.1~~GHVQ01015642.1.p2  ORF type:complete len:135 (+),score=29.25 GHVQ01015642.1:202-606(+)
MLTYGPHLATSTNQQGLEEVCTSSSYSTAEIWDTHTLLQRSSTEICLLQQATGECQAAMERSELAEIQEMLIASQLPKIGGKRQQAEVEEGDMIPAVTEGEGDKINHCPLCLSCAMTDVCAQGCEKLWLSVFCA